MNEIFAAIYTRLNDQLAVTVFDHVDQDTQDYPFVNIDPIQTVDDDTINTTGFEATVQIISYSRYRGTKEINDLIDNIYSALHQWEMPNTSSYAIGNLIEQSRNVFTQPDGLTRNSVQTFLLYFEPL